MKRLIDTLTVIPWLKIFAVMSAVVLALAWISDYSNVLNFTFTSAPPRTTMTFQFCLATILIGWLAAVAFVKMPPEQRKAMLVLFFMSACLFFIRMDKVVGHYDVIGQVFLGKARAPNQYRMLVPSLAAGIRWIFPDLTWMDAARVWNLLFCLLWPPLLVRYLRYWFDDRLAMTLTMAAVLMIPLSFVYEYPDDMLEIAIFTLGFGFIRDKHYKSLWALILLATCSRETSAFLVAATFFSLFNFNQVRDLKRFWHTFRISLMSLIAWLIPFVGLRLAFGLRSYRCEFFMGIINLNYIKKAYMLKDSAFFEFLFIIGTLVLVAILFGSRKRMDDFLKRNVITVVFMLIVTYCIAMIGEVRVFYPLLPLLVPMAASSLIKSRDPLNPQ